MRLRAEPSLTCRPVAAAYSCCTWRTRSAWVTAPAALAVEPQASEVEALWRRYLAAQDAKHLARAAYDAAMARLPWWAAPGPTSVGFDGTFSGPVSHWPAKRDYRRPAEPGRYFRIRVDPQDVERDCRNHVGFKSPAELDALRVRMLADLLVADKALRHCTPTVACI